MVIITTIYIQRTFTFCLSLDPDHDAIQSNIMEILLECTQLLLLTKVSHNWSTFSLYTSMKISWIIMIQWYIVNRTNVTFPGFSIEKKNMQFSTFPWNGTTFINNIEHSFLNQFTWSLIFFWLFSLVPPPIKLTTTI